MARMTNHSSKFDRLILIDNGLILINSGLILKYRSFYRQVYDKPFY